MNVFERRERQLLTEALRAAQDENARFLRLVEIHRAVAWGSIVAIGLVLIVKYFGEVIWTALLSLMP